MDFKKWLATKKRLKNFNADFQEDVLHDNKFPVLYKNDLEKGELYLYTRIACNEAILAYKKLFKKYCL